MSDVRVTHGPPPLSRLWDARPLADDSWGNILGFNDGTGDGHTIAMRLWIDRRPSAQMMNPLPIYRPAGAPLPPFFADGGTRRCCIPSPSDLEIVRRHFLGIADPRNPNWFAVAEKLAAKGHQRAALDGLSPSELLAMLDATEPPSSGPKRKRGTGRGGGRLKLIAALTKHHRYADNSCLNLDPIGNNELAKASGVSTSTASAFFNSKFKGHQKSKVLCRDVHSLAAALKTLNGEYAPHDLYGRRPAEEVDRDDE